MNKKQNKFIASLVLASLVVAIYGYFPKPNNANAVNSLTNAKATISDSAPGVSATTVINVTSSTSTAANGYFEVAMPAGQFGSIVGKISCSDGLTPSTSDANTGKCTGVVAAGPMTITLTAVTNPTATTSQVINVSHYDVAGNLADRVQVVVQIIDNVWMTARVDATLTFTVAGLGTSDTVNGDACTATSSATSTPFGTLDPGTPSTVCQELSVTTNASDGFVVTVEQDADMTSDGGDTIDSFKDGSGLQAPDAWTAPATVLDSDNTYGHMGLTSDDASVVGFNYAGSAYAGLNGTAPISVFTHDGPADGSTQDKGLASVAYTAEIDALQQAGDYESTLTYIATPTY